MIDTRHPLLDYVRPSLESLWHWEEDGAVLVWHDGATIAFREEVIQVLETLRPQGLPNFEAVVTLLAACQGRLPGIIEILGEPLLPGSETVTSQKLLLRMESRRRREHQVREDLSELQRVAQLPRELTKPLRAKCLLAESVFEGPDARRMHRDVNPEDLLNPELTSAELNGNPEDTPEGNLLREVHWVAKGLRRHTAESLQLRLQTGLDELPVPIETGLAPAERARQLLQELAADPDQRLIGRAALELMATIRLPRRLTEPDRSAIGGVADLSNRGPLDRLLLSELAHDDLTLTTRIALNEALYLRPEPPKHQPGSNLAILLDSGLRMWGLPRAFATATALAMIANGGGLRSLRAWRAHRHGIVPVDLLSQASLREHLSVLEPEIHPGDALQMFRDVLEGRDHLQSVLITHSDTLRDSRFRKKLAACKGVPSHVVTVNREGHFMLHAAPFAPQQPLCESRLDVNRLFSSAAAIDLIRSRSLDPDLPAFIQQSSCPLLLPIAGRVTFWARSEEGKQLAVMNDRRLVEFGSSEHGGEVRIPRLPSGRTLWLERVEDEICLVKTGSQQRPCRLVKQHSSAPPEIIELGVGLSAQAAMRAGGVLLVIREADVCAYRLSNGQLIDRAPSPSRWHRGRFFAAPQRFHYLNWDGTRVRFEPIVFPPSVDGSSVVTVFDREGFEGPWILNQLCQVISLATGERVQIPLPIGQSSHRRNIQVSRDGHRIYLSIPDLSWHALLDVRQGKAEIMRAPLEDMTALDPCPPLPHWNLTRSLEAISASARHGLRLRTRKGTEKVLTLDGGHRLRFVESQPLPTPTMFHRFEAFPSIPAGRLGASLDCVTWPKGDRTLFDHRGMLHLKSHNTSIPEITLLLSEGETAAWAGDQTVCGSAFFLREGQSSNPQRIYNLVQELIRNL